MVFAVRSKAIGGLSESIGNKLRYMIFFGPAVACTLSLTALCIIIFKAIAKKFTGSRVQAKSQFGRTVDKVQNISNQYNGSHTTKQEMHKKKDESESAQKQDKKSQKKSKKKTKRKEKKKEEQYRMPRFNVAEREDIVQF